MGWTAAGLLDLCERGHLQDRVSQALILLASGYSAPAAGWDALGLGTLTRTLLDLYQASFGRQIDAVAECPQCNTKLDLSFTVDDVRGSFSDALPTSGDGLYRVELAGWEVTARNLTVADLRAASAHRDLQMVRGTLVERCVIDAVYCGEPVHVRELPEAVILAVSSRLGEAEPAGDPRVGLACHDCGRQWDQGLDITAHLWIELQSAAGRLQREIAALARELGWSESEILAMTPWRRRSYLALLGVLE